jgi:TonB family protein
MTGPASVAAAAQQVRPAVSKRRRAGGCFGLVGLSIVLLGANPIAGQEGTESKSGGFGEGVASDYDEPPKALKITKPEYPDAAFAKKVEGTIVLEILIDAGGRVAKARVITSIAALDAAALECVRAWEFKPAVKDGRPVAAIARAPVGFRITGRPDRPSPRAAGRGAPAPTGQPPASLRSGAGQPQEPEKNASSTRRLGVPSFDPQGADFTVWLSHFRREIFENWVIPKAADPESHGQVDFEFIVDRDGSISNVHILASSNVPALDRAARNALLGSQLQALPPDFAPSRVTMGLTFWYDKRPDESDVPSAK